jgi:hypothetical protein
MLSEKMVLLRDLSETYTQYVNFDAEMDFMARIGLARAAMRAAHPGANLDIEPLKSLPGFPSAQQTRYHHELWAKLGSLSSLIKLYFDDDTRLLVDNFVFALRSSPATVALIDTQDPHEFRRLVDIFRSLDLSAPEVLLAALSPYFAVPAADGHNNASFNALLDGMKRAIDQDLRTRSAGQ